MPAASMRGDRLANLVPSNAAVMVHVMLGGIFRMFSRVKMVPVGQMGMMARSFMLARLVMFSRFAMMLRSLFVMLGGFLMVLGAFVLGHDCDSPF